MFAFRGEGKPKRVDDPVDIRNYLEKETDYQVFESCYF
jgi:hypothetical protein